MGFENMFRGGAERRYRRVPGDKRRNLRWRSVWVRNANGKLLGIRIMSPSKRLGNRRKFSLKVLLQKIFGAVYGEVLSAVKRVDGGGMHPSYIFSTQWGLPIMSHPHLF